MAALNKPFLSGLRLGRNIELLLLYSFVHRLLIRKGTVCALYNRIEGTIGRGLFGEANMLRLDDATLDGL